MIQTGKIHPKQNSLYLSTTTLSFHFIDLLAEALRKLANNFTLLIARFWMLETFDSTNPDKLNNFLFQ